MGTKQHFFSFVFGLFGTILCFLCPNPNVEIKNWFKNFFLQFLLNRSLVSPASRPVINIEEDESSSHETENKVFNFFFKLDSQLATWRERPLARRSSLSSPWLRPSLLLWPVAKANWQQSYESSHHSYRGISSWLPGFQSRDTKTKQTTEKRKPITSFFSELQTFLAFLGENSTASPSSFIITPWANSSYHSLRKFIISLPEQIHNHSLRKNNSERPVDALAEKHQWLTNWLTTWNQEMLAHLKTMNAP